MELLSSVILIIVSDSAEYYKPVPPFGQVLYVLFSDDIIVSLSGPELHPSSVEAPRPGPLRPLMETGDEALMFFEFDQK